MKVSTILIADDYPENINIIVDALKDIEIPHKIIKAINGEILCTLAEKRIPDLIITDWEMPVMDGIEAIRHLKALETTRDIPIIMCTGIMTTSENLKMALDSGAIDYIRKPIDKIELLARVFSMLKLGESYRTIKEQNIILEQQKKEIQIQSENLHEANNLLLKRNLEIKQQNDEIQAQTQELEKFNIELEKLSVVASETSNAVIITDNQGKYIWVNKGYTRLFGYEPEEVCIKMPKKLLNSVNSREINDLIQRALDTGESVNYEFEAISKFGKRIWLQTTISPIIDKLGSVSKLIVIDSDISKIKEAELEILAQSRLLARQNNQIKDSITYAKRIQDAILPSIDFIKTYFPDSFVYFKPKDIVSGDFYWFSVQGEKIFLATVDCTGHGVAGAFMSLIGNSLLNHIVNEKKIYNPSEILKELNLGVDKALSQSKSKNDENEDGMDLTIIYFNKNSHEVQIACANQTVLYVKNEEITEIEGDPISIGDLYSKGEVIKFNNYSFPLTKNTALYLFSDGYQDQIGGKKDKKFLLDNFKNFLFAQKDEPMEIQCIKINEAFIEWKGTNRQTDDVMVIGIRSNENN